MIEKVFCRAIGREKNLYTSFREVKEELQNIRSTSVDKFSKGYKPVRAYFCMMCSGWHLTHQKTVDVKADEFVHGIVFGDTVSDLPYLQDICKRKKDLAIAQELLYKEEAEIINALLDKEIYNVDEIDNILHLTKVLKKVTNRAVFKEEYVKFGWKR